MGTKTGVRLGEAWTARARAAPLVAGTMHKPAAPRRRFLHLDPNAFYTLDRRTPFSATNHFCQRTDQKVDGAMIAFVDVELLKKPRVAA
jgi:hypothetical protein